MCGILQQYGPCQALHHCHTDLSLSLSLLRSKKPGKATTRASRTSAPSKTSRCPNPLGPLLGPSWALLGPLGSLLGASWGPLGALLVSLGGILEEVLGGTKEAWRPLRGSKKRARGSQEGPKRGPRGPKRPPRGLQERSWGHFGDDFSIKNRLHMQLIFGSTFGDPHGHIFDRFLWDFRVF